MPSGNDGIQHLGDPGHPVAHRRTRQGMPWRRDAFEPVQRQMIAYLQAAICATVRGRQSLLKMAIGT